MNPWRLAAVLLVGCTLAACVEGAAGQGWPYRPPIYPTISPWLNLFHANGGPVDNYNTYVRPEQVLMRAISGQRAAILAQEAQFQTLRREVAGYERSAAVGPTGTGGGFMNYSHYYPSLNRAPTLRIR